MIKHLFIGDNLPILRNMQSDSVDLIYLDPPFNSGKQWENPIRASTRKAKVSFKDTWNLSDIHVDEEYELYHYAKDAIPLIDSLHKINGGSWRAYLIYMGVRLAEMRRVLKESGTIYYHCDPTMSHGVKLLMDSIFSKSNFRNEIIWCYDRWEAKSNDFQKMHDVILRYSKQNAVVFNTITEIDSTRQKTLDRGYTTNKLKDGTRQLIVYKGNEKKPNIQNLIKKDKFDNVLYKDPSGRPLKDYWLVNFIHPKSKERTGYPTQKPLALLERIIKASSNEGDVVLDPFCGCATACVVAERLSRNWIGIDLSMEAQHFIENRIDKESLQLIDEGYRVNPAQEKRVDLPKLDKNSVKANLYAEKRGKCAGCGNKKELADMDLDHIVARVRGGQDEWRNFQLLCRACNTSKGGKGMTEWRNDLMQKRISEFATQQIKENQAWLAKQQQRKHKA